MKYARRFAAFFASCLMLGSTGLSYAVSAEDTTQADSYDYGDINLDHSVDVSDAVLLARYSAEDKTANISARGKQLADANNDGEGTKDDTIAILEYIAKKRPTLGPSVQPPQPVGKTVNLMQDITAADAEAKTVDEAFTDSQYAFAAGLFKESDRSNEERKNLLISPLSVSVALSMTANGAREQTLSEMENVLGGDLKIADLNAYYKDLLNTLPNNEKAALYPANSIWIKDAPQISVPQEFLQTNANYYGADAFRAPFNQQTLDDINGWVNENTHEMIPNLLDKFPSDDVFMYLINALAFEAEWDTPYTTDEVFKSKFTPYDGNTFETDMLSAKLGIYLEDEYAAGFVKYYKDCGYSFAAILPKESKSVTVADYIGMMTQESLQKLLNKRQQCPVITTMPKFKFAYDTELSGALKNLGMPAAFDDELSNFTGLNEGDAYIGRVLHKTFIQLDENGTKAGAVTAVEMLEKTAVEPEPKRVDLNRPFIFVIMDEVHHIPVFMGYVMNPAEETPAE